MLGTSVIFYLFFAGVAGGSYIAAALYDALFGMQGIPRPLAIRSGLEKIDAYMQTGYVIAPCAVVLAGVFLLADMGFPHQAFRALLQPFATVSSFGATSLVAFAVVAFATVMLSMRQECAGRALAVLKVLGCVLAFATIGYTGVLLMGLKANPFWDSALLPLLFCASSLTSGISACLLAGLVVKPGRRSPADDWFWHVLVIALLVEAALLGAFLAAGWLSGAAAAQASVARLLQGDLAVPFFILLLGVGLLFPIACHARIGKVRKEAVMLVASVAELVGGLSLRALIVLAAVHSLDAASLCYTFF